MASGNQGQARDASASAQANPWNFSTMAKSDRNKTGLKDQDQVYWTRKLSNDARAHAM